MSRRFIKRHKMAAGLIIAGFLFLVFSLAIPMVRSYRGEESITVSPRAGKVKEVTEKKKRAKEEKKVFYSQNPDVERFKKYVGKKTEALKKPISTPLVIVAIDNKSQGEPPAVVNISPEATVTASSFIYNPTNVTDGVLQTIWSPVSGDPGPWLQLIWNTPKVIKSVSLTGSNINDGVLAFSDGSTISIGGLSSTPNVIDSEKTVTWVKLQIGSVVPGANPEVSEFEVDCFSTLCSYTMEGVVEYCQDLANMGYRVILHPSNEGTPQTLKEYIKKWYDNPYQSVSSPDLVFPPTVETGPMWMVVGAVFIGDLPVPKTADGVSIYYAPIDSYFMDFDASWSINDGILEVSFSSKDQLYPEIWLGRIPTDDLPTILDKVYRIIQYLSKVHSFREDIKVGIIPGGKALLYVDEGYSSIETPGLRLLFYPNRIEDRRIFRYSSDPTTSADFLNRVSVGHEREYLWLDLAVSGDKDEICFEERYVLDTSSPIPASAIRSSNGPLYCVLRGPGFCNYLVPNYIASGFIFGDNSSALICIGTTTTLNIYFDSISYEPFYSTLRIGNFGEAYKSLLKTVIQAPGFNPVGGLGLGFTLLGDPTLLAYGKDNNVNPSYAFDYLAKGVTGGDSNLPDLYVKGITVGYVPETGANHVFLNLVYDDPQVIKVEFEEDGYLKALEQETPEVVTVPYKIYVDNVLFESNMITKKLKQFNTIKSLNPIGVSPDDNEGHIIKVVVDPDNYIPERDDNNNELEEIESLYLGTNLDLIIQDMGFYRKDEFYRKGKVWMNKRNNFWVRIENKGAVPNEYLGDDAIFHLRLTMQNSLSGTGETHSIPFYDLTQGRPGAIIGFSPYELILGYPDISSDPPNSTYEFTVEVDSTDQISEDGSGEYNNTKTENIQLPF